MILSGELSPGGQHAGFSLIVVSACTPDHRPLNRLGNAKREKPRQGDQTRRGKSIILADRVRKSKGEVPRRARRRRNGQTRKAKQHDSLSPYENR